MKTAIKDGKVEAGINSVDATELHRKVYGDSHED